MDPAAYLINEGTSMFPRAHVLAPIITLLLATSGGSAVVSALPSGVDAGKSNVIIERKPQPPGDLLDLSRWKLQLPVDTRGGMDPGCAVAEIKPPMLATYASEWFEPTEDGVALRAQARGCRTANTKYARSELRELTEDGRNAAWDARTGTHTMILREAVTRLPGPVGRVVSAQIHDGSTGMFQVKIDLKRASGPGVVGLCYELLKKTKGCLDDSYVLGTPFDLTVSVSRGRIRVDYNGERRIDRPYTRRANYFKAGAYLQTNVRTGARAGDVGEVVISRLSVSHSDDTFELLARIPTGEPEPSPVNAPVPAPSSGPSQPTVNSYRDNSHLDDTPLDDTPLDDTPLDNTPRDNAPPGSLEVSDPLAHR